MHEEGLHRIEEERHDYDLHITNIERSIQLLDPLAQQNRIMSEQERSAWQLPPDFGGPIHRKVVGRIYGRSKCDAIIHGQATQPANVIPVMLLRMRQYAEQWKAAQVRSIVILWGILLIHLARVGQGLA
jgi:paired amphipathic helix protein Sin3a